MIRRTVLALCLVPLVSPAVSLAQVVVVHGPGRRPVPPAIRQQFRVESVDINATIRDQSANVQMAQTFRNDSSMTIEAQFLFPLPPEAAISGMTLLVNGRELPAELKTKEQARSIYESIVRQQKDPALLEYLGNGMFRTSVFPIPARQERRVEIRYTQLLRQDSGLVDFSLPLGTVKHTGQPIEKTTVSVRLQTTEPIKTVYSPTHTFDIKRPDDNRATCRLTLPNLSSPNDVRLLYGTRGGEVGMNLISYRPDPNKDGYYLLLASPKVKAKKGTSIPKTVQFVVDRSGSMSGEKVEQAKAALRQMINQLGDKDTFNVVSYSTDVEEFRPELEAVNAKTRKQALGFVDDVFAGGGTNIDEALRTGLRPLTDRTRPSYVMFLTDGLPTVGVTDELEIARNARSANKASARIFSFGVGYDVNSRLLDRLTRDNRGASVYVKPGEDIEVAVSNLFRKVSSPVMTELKLAVQPTDTDTARKPTSRSYPRDMPDLFHGEQLVVVGRYSTPGPVHVSLAGDVNGKTRRVQIDGELTRHSTSSSHAFVERLWATRRIGEIIDQLDLNGRNQELVDELVALSLKHGILTPYTSFLADENVQLARTQANVRRAGQMLSDGLSQASGAEGFRQRGFKQMLRGAGNASAADSASSGYRLNAGRPSRGGASGARPAAGNRPGSAPLPPGGGGGGFGLGGGGRSAITKEDSDKSSPAQRVRRIGTKTFYWKKDEWRDAEVTDEQEKAPIEIEQFSKEYFELAAKDQRFSKYLSLKEPLLIVLEGKTYRIVPAKAKTGQP